MFGKRLLTEKQEKLLGLRLKELRNSINFTQEQMAKALYVSRSCISNYESGQRTLSMEMVKKYSDYFQVDVNYVLGTENENREMNEYLYRKMQNSKHITPEGYLDISDLSSLDKLQIIDFCEYLRLRAKARAQSKTTA
ncbi:MAG: helix-turn-helix transcriptional regulator [Clostridia bacterium]|nr:helix-turn-helix transcriptional regulator [Clostridia bacterium]